MDDWIELEFVVVGMGGDVGYGYVGGSFLCRLCSVFL